MITIHPDPTGNLVEIHLEGALSEQDFSNATRTLEAYVKTHGKAPSLLLRADSIPHWDSIAALGKHIHLVETFQKQVPKVAIVTDSTLLGMLPNLADFFLQARIRHFSRVNLDQAKAWASAAGDDPGSFEVMDDLPDDTIGFRIRGIITAEDYEQTLTPLIEGKLKNHQRLNLLAVIDSAFESYTVGAMWDDARLGFMHLTDFRRIAIATDINWIRLSTRFFSPLIAAEVQVYDLTQLDQARDWVTSGQTDSGN
ncbi:MAG TPA: STAS/SEC14 domain-containing protein [Thiolinea sp.]|nr:STAS/SEC14 domain-containing protein [Thiolinea sp.]